MSRADTEPRTLSPTARRIFGVTLGVVSGVTVAVQSRINGELGVRLGDGIAAAVVSFGVGLVLLAVLVPAMPAGRRGLRALRAALAGVSCAAGSAWAGCAAPCWWPRRG
ncbi:hypothetical protein GCM10027605_64310 [Micromonospora zhanjiangensis]